MPEVVQDRGEEGVARLEDGDLAAEDRQADPEVRIQADRQVAVDGEDAIRIVDQLVEVDAPVIDRRDRVAEGLVVVDVDAGAGARVVLQVEVDLRLDVALDANLDQAADAERGARLDGGAERRFGRVVAAFLDAVVEEEETLGEDDRDVDRLVAAGLENHEAARAEAVADVGGGLDLARELRVEAGEDRESLLVQELQVERREVVLEQHHFLAGQQAEDARRAGEDRE